MNVVIGRPQQGVVVSVLDSARANGEGWFPAEIEVRVTAWRGRYASNFQVSDLEVFASGIDSMMESASTATLISTDGYLDLTLTGEELGHVIVSGEAWDTPRTGSHLSFDFELDQTFLPSLVASVRQLVEQLAAD